MQVIMGETERLMRQRALELAIEYSGKIVPSEAYSATEAAQKFYDFLSGTSAPKAKRGPKPKAKVAAAPKLGRPKKKRPYVKRSDYWNKAD